MSCATCNSNKGTKEVLEKNKASIAKFDYNNYPNNKTDFLIVHAYLDKYEDYICFHKDIFVQCVNNSEKGQKTIIMCDLTRGSLALQREKEFKIRSSSVGYVKAIASQIGSDEILNKAEIRETKQFFINSVLQEFVRELNKDTTIKRKKALEEMLRLNVSHVRVYRIMILLCNISILKNIDLKDLAVDYFKVNINDVDKIFSKMVELLEIQKSILGLKKYRDMIKFITHSSVYYSKINMALKETTTNMS